MGAIKRQLEEQIRRLAWEIADHTRTGPEDWLCEKLEGLLWDIATDKPGRFERLCGRYLGHV